MYKTYLSEQDFKDQRKRMNGCKNRKLNMHIKRRKSQPCPQKNNIRHMGRAKFDSSRKMAYTRSVQSSNEYHCIYNVENKIKNQNRHLVSDLQNG